MRPSLPHMLDRDFINPFAGEDFPAEVGEQPHCGMACENVREFLPAALEGDLEAISEPFDKGRVFDKEFWAGSIHVSLASVGRGLERTGVSERVLRVNAASPGDGAVCSVTGEL